MSRPPYVRFYGNDWFTGCMGLKADERGVYISMCVFIWTTGRRVPLDDAEACRMMGLQFNNYQRIRNGLAAKGKVQQHEDGFGIHRAEKELDHARNRTEVSSPDRDGRRADEDASERDAEGTARVDQVRSETGEGAASGGALLGASAGTSIGAMPPTSAGTCLGDDQKTQSFLRATKEPESKPKEKKERASAPSPVDALAAYQDWNATALRCGLPQASKMTPDRQRKIIARLKDYGQDGWAQALANIERSSFLTGKNDRGWTATLDFLVKPDAFGKVHDGTYGNGRHNTAAVPTTMKPHEIELQREAEEARRMGLI